jgi:hypothetical protein
MTELLRRAAVSVYSERRDGATATAKPGWLKCSCGRTRHASAVVSYRRVNERPHFRGVRVAHVTGYNRVEGNRRATTN